MAEIKGYLLTAEEEKACTDLVKKMRERKTLAVSFSGCIRVKANNDREAIDIFWKWVEDLQYRSFEKWPGVITWSPYFEYEGIQED